MKLLKIFAAAITVSAAIATAAVAGDHKVGSLMIEGTWARPSVGKTGNSAAYMTITNHGDKSDKLVAVSTPFAGKAELHTHINDNGIMRMRPVEGGIPVPEKGSVALKPGGYHIMLMRLNEPIKKGERIPLTLTFERSGEFTIQADVQMMKPGVKGGMQKHK